MVTVAPGLRLHYRWLGPQRATPVVAPLGTWWGRQLDRLAQNVPVLVYDPRGRGRSDPRPETGGSLDDEIEDLEQVRRALEIDRISLLGWSFLGAVVALYASRYPDRVERVVQVGPMVPRMHPFWTQFIADYGARAQSAAASPGDRSIWGSVIAPQLADPARAESIVAKLDLTSANEDPARISAWGARMTAGQGGWDWRGDAARITVPVLTLHGVRDNIPLEASQEWARTFPNGRLLLIDSAGHYPHFEQPDAFTDALLTFFSGQWPAGANV
jgi:proline iminopeptidase